jgi:predicted O-methyltransferase YrrM
MEFRLGQWFHPENQEMLDKLIRDHEIKDVIEIGCYLGASAIFMAQRVEKVTTIDHFSQSVVDFADKDNYYQVLYNLRFLNISNVEVLAMSSEEANKKYPDMTADLVYIDGSHDYENIKKDIELWLPRAKKIICGDDYTENEEFGIIQAVDELGGKNYDRFWYKII